MQKESGKRYCVYARVSTEEQAEKDLSIPFQLERCRYHAQGKGGEVVKEFVDAGESARTDKRPEFQKMIDAARAKEFDVILVHKFDRFARNDYDFVVYEKLLEDPGIVVESVSEPGDASTPAGLHRGGTQSSSSVLSGFSSAMSSASSTKSSSCYLEKTRGAYQYRALTF